MRVVSAVLLLLVCAASRSGAEDFDHFWKAMKRLQDKLFKGYDEDINPYSTKYANVTWNANGSFASIFLFRSRLLSVQEREQSFSTVTGVILEWTDPRLVWNAEAYQQIDHIYVNRSLVWMPEIVPCESTGVKAVTLFDANNVNVYSSGKVMLFAYFFATHNCDIKSDNFPFDTNHCTMCFMLPGNYPEELKLAGTIAPNPDLFVFFYFVITRQPQFWVDLIILPTFFIGVLVLIGIFFGEEANALNALTDLGLNGMTSLTVIVGILADSIAKSKDLSALGRFVYYDIMIVVVAVIVVLFSIKLRKRLLKWCDVKLAVDKTDAFWLRVKRFGASTKIARYTLFFIFFALHLANLITILVPPADSGAFEQLTTLNATYS